MGTVLPAASSVDCDEQRHEKARSLARKVDTAFVSRTVSLVIASTHIHLCPRLVPYLFQCLSRPLCRMKNRSFGFSLSKAAVEAALVDGWGFALLPSPFPALHAAMQPSSDWPLGDTCRRRPYRPSVSLTCLRSKQGDLQYNRAYRRCLHKESQ